MSPRLRYLAKNLACQDAENVDAEQNANPGYQRHRITFEILHKEIGGRRILRINDISRECVENMQPNFRNGQEDDKVERDQRQTSMFRHIFLECHIIAHTLT